MKGRPVMSSRLTVAALLAATFVMLPQNGQSAAAQGGSAAQGQSQPPRGPAAQLAQIEADMAVARRYVAAMRSNDHDTQLAMLEEDATFEDPMTTITGRDRIAEAWRRQQIEIQGFDETLAFHSGRGVVMIGGTVRFAQTFQRQGGDPIRLEFAIPSQIAVTVRGDRISRHIDFVDTGAFARQLIAHIERLSAN